MKLRRIHNERQPAAIHAQSIAGSHMWAPLLCPWVRPFLEPLYAFFGNRTGFGAAWVKIANSELAICGGFLSEPRFPPPNGFSENRLRVEINADARATSPPKKGGNLGILGFYRGCSHYTCGDLRMFPVRNKRGGPPDGKSFR